MECACYTLSKVKDIQVKYLAPENVEKCIYPQSNGGGMAKIVTAQYLYYSLPMKSSYIKLSNVQISKVRPSSAIFQMMEALMTNCFLAGPMESQ